MKKIIILILLLFILIFSYPTELKHSKASQNTTSQKNAVSITTLNNLKFDSDEEKIKALEKFTLKKNIQTRNIKYKNKKTAKHTSRHNKGKIMFNHKNTIPTKNSNE